MFFILRKRKADDVDGQSVSKKQKKEDEQLEMKLKVGAQNFQREKLHKCFQNVSV